MPDPSQGLRAYARVTFILDRDHDQIFAVEEALVECGVSRGETGRCPISVVRRAAASLKAHGESVDTVRVSSPRCPRAGHDHTKVVRDGVSRGGARPRQRWRCVSPDGSWHRFLGASVGDEEPATGPPRSRFTYPPAVIAAALIGVAEGWPYTHAAKRSQAAARRHGPAPPTARAAISGQLVADWLDRFGAVVAAPNAETGWPAVLTVGSVGFTSGARSGARRRLFRVLAAWGQNRDGQQGRVWRLAVSSRDDADAWQRFFAALPGRPDVIVADHMRAVGAAAQRQWPGGTPTIVAPDDGTHALAAALHAVSESLGGRAWTLRHRLRTNLLLELVRLRLNGGADARRWADAIEDHLVRGAASVASPGVPRGGPLRG